MPKIILAGGTQREYARQAINRAPQGAIVTIMRANRTNEQNAKMWAMLHDIARCEPEDRQWTPDTWKAAFMHALGHEVQFGEGLDGSGPFPVGFRSSQLGVGQMSDLIEVMYEYGARHGVTWRETSKSGFGVEPTQ